MIGQVNDNYGPSIDISAFSCLGQYAALLVKKLSTRSIACVDIPQGKLGYGNVIQMVGNIL
jgi:hypothetical protein